MAAALEYSGKKKLPTKWIPPKKPAYREVKINLTINKNIWIFLYFFVN